MDYNISIVLDIRRAKKSGLYPVKLRVYSIILKSAKLYSTKFAYTEKEFKSVWLTEKPRQVHKTARLELQAALTKANDKAKKVVPFTFEGFEKRIKRNSGDSQNVYTHYTSIIEELLELERIGSAESYEQSCNSIKKYNDYRKGKQVEQLQFSEITHRWLQDYEHYMENTLQRSRTTVGIYLRSLRAVFNYAANEGDIDRDKYYPFGRGKYIIPSQRKTKRALSPNELKVLKEAVPETHGQLKAQDFWFFSYSCCGMNTKDILLLKNKNIDFDNNLIRFYRSKVKNTAKDQQKETSLHLTSFAKSVIEKYGKTDTDKNAYIFPYINDKMTATEIDKKINGFIHYINVHIKKLAESVELSPDISTIWARHTFATIAIHKKAGMEFVMEALSHSDMKTTMNYFAGFEDKVKAEVMDDIMDL